MKVFISWSGNKSHRVALVFREWLPSVIQSLEPYVSSEDIDKGARWSTDIAKELEDSTVGILCVTKENLHAPWLSFEAGALSKTMDKAYVTPFLFDIKRSEVNGPILQFQSTIFEKDDLKKLIHTLNKACGDVGISEAMLDKAFEVWYPTLECELNALKEIDDSANGDAETVVEAHTSEIIEEILELSRDNQKLLRNPDTKLIDSVDTVKQQLDTVLQRIDRNDDDDRRNVKHYRSMFVEELLHTILSECPKQYGFLITLSFYQDEFPWIYSMGRELITTLQSKTDMEMKREAIAAFRRVLSFTYEHPFVREVCYRKKDSPRTLKNMQYILLNLLDELEQECLQEYRTLRQPNRHSIPVDLGDAI